MASAQNLRLDAVVGLEDELLRLFVGQEHGAYAARPRPGIMEHQRKRARATVQPIPFFNPERKRA